MAGPPPPSLSFFFFNDTATTEIYTLSLHDALPISQGGRPCLRAGDGRRGPQRRGQGSADRKSTRLNSSHLVISYAVFCLKKKKEPDRRGHRSASHRRDGPAAFRASRRRDEHPPQPD